MVVRDHGLIMTECLLIGKLGSLLFTAELGCRNRVAVGLL
jgi:hypothetical protein